jgi:hypothetical protein
MLIGAVLLVGCGGPAKNTVGGGGGSGSDTSVSNPTPTAGVPCAQEIQIVCGEGYVDGCGGNKTTVHVCVDATANAGPPCAQEIALQCPDGQIDACLSTPAAGENHICMVKPNATTPDSLPAAASATTPEAAATK